MDKNKNNNSNHERSSTILKPKTYEQLLIEVSEVVASVSEEINVMPPHPSDIHIKNERTDGRWVKFRVTASGVGVEFKPNREISYLLQQAGDLRLKSGHSLFPNCRLLFQVGRDLADENKLLIRVTPTPTQEDNDENTKP